MNKKIKISMVTNHFGITGISTVIINYCKELYHRKYDLTVIAGQPIAEENKVECVKNGIHLIELPSRHKEPAKHYIGLWKALKQNHYDIVHIHGSSSMMAIELTIAKLAGEKIRIAHSHNSMCSNMKIHKILNPYFRKTYTKSLSCGKLAGDWLFGENNFEILPNGFHTEQFVFDESEREKIRRKLGIVDRFVVGHVGRFNEQKNQTYLIKSFEHVAKVRSDAVLLLVGTGPDFDKIKYIVDNSLYRDQIILYGVTKETRAVYSAMDVFVFPSKFEGLPVVLLEAQITGLPCIVSDKITNEVDFGEICWLSVEEDPQNWAKAILQTAVRSNTQRSDYRKEHITKIEHYDISQTVKQLDTIYDDLIQR